MVSPTVEDFSTPGKGYQRGLLACLFGWGGADFDPMPKSLHMRQVGANLKLVREALGLSQAEMAARFGLADKSKLSHWERGKHYPDPYFVYQLWVQARITADWIYLGERGSLPYDLAASLPKAGAA